jgi:hypothetical protein
MYLVRCSVLLLVSLSGCLCFSCCISKIGKSSSEVRLIVIVRIVRMVRIVRIVRIVKFIV